MTKAVVWHERKWRYV